MRNNKNAFLALTVLSGYLIWQNRFAIQRQLESLGFKIPLLKGNLEEAAKSIASQVSGKMEQGATIAEELTNKKIS